MPRVRTLEDFWNADKTGWSPLEKLLVAYLLFEERSTGKRTFSRQDLATITNSSIGSISRTVRRLKEKNIVSVEPSHRPEDGSIEGNSFTVKLPSAKAQKGT